MHPLAALAGGAEDYGPPAGCKVSDALSCLLDDRQHNTIPLLFIFSDTEYNVFYWHGALQ